MKLKYITLVLTIAFAIMLTACQSGGNNEPDSQSKIKNNIAEISDSTEVPHKVIAYYFYGNRRCASCKKIEAWSNEAIETGFADKTKSGHLQWITINTDKSENEHYVEDYQLYTKSLVIVNMKDGKQTVWKNLDKIWQLLDNKDYFIEYVQFEIDEYLKSN
jgi:hypothetical protein